MSTPPLHERPRHTPRRGVTPVVGAISGAVAGILVAAIVDLVEGDVTPVAYVGGALIGAVIGVVLALLVPTEIDDGADDAHAVPFGRDMAQGRADATLEGAHAPDTPS